MVASSRAEVGRIAQMAPRDVHEPRVAPGCPDGREVSDCPDDKTGYPEAQTECDSGRDRAVCNRYGARSPAEIAVSVLAQVTQVLRQG